MWSGTNKQVLFSWLALAALLEWLILRTVTRAAIHIPKSPAIITGYTIVNHTGLLLAALVALLSLLLLGWIAWREWRQGERALPALLAARAALSLIFLVVVPAGWPAFLTHLLTLLILALLVAPTLVRWGAILPGPAAALLLPALAILAGLLYQALPALYAAAGWPGPPPLTGLFFNLGELLVLVSAALLWWVYGRPVSIGYSLLAALPALLFALSFWRDPAMTGILTVWSTGMTLILPWPLYVLALWFVGATILANWRRNSPVAYAVILLAAAGYASQLSSQLFCALIALWLLARAAPVARPLPRSAPAPLAAPSG